MCISFSRFQPVTLLWMYASNTSKETKVILCMLGRILIPELLLLICCMGCACLCMLSRILLPELLLLICCLGCTCSGHEVPIGFPLPLLPLSVIS